MASVDENVAFFLRSVEERHKIFCDRLNELTSALTGEVLATKKTAAANALAAIESLMSIISTKDHPSWATSFRGQLARYVEVFNQTGEATRLANAIISLSPVLKAHRWQFDEAEAVRAVDFESLYKTAYENSSAHEKFERLLELLVQLVESGEIDSVVTIDALQKLISTIRKNMRGTYFQTVGASRFASAIIRNYLTHRLHDLPVIGGILKSVQEVMKELEIEMSEVHAEVKKSLAIQARVDLPAIEYKPDETKT